MKPQMTLSDMQQKVAEAEKRISGSDLKLWQLIRINPAQWSVEGEKAWVIAVAGPLAIWYDETSQQFSVSVYSSFSVIENTAGKVGQSDVPDNMLSLLTALRAAY